MECRWDRIPKSINLKGSILPSLASDLEVPKCTQYLSNMLAKWRWFTGQQATKSHPKKSKWPSGWVFLISGTCVPANGARCFGRWNSDSAKHMWENHMCFQFGLSLTYNQSVNILRFIVNESEGSDYNISLTWKQESFPIFWVDDWSGKM